MVLIANSTKNKNVDCAVGEFRDFSVCSNTCGGGTQTRSRTVITPKSGNGKDCPPLSERRPCNTQVCPVNCEVGEFSDFSDCTRECGGGTQTRTKTIIQNQVGTGAPCPELSNTIACNTQPCFPLDCKVGNFSDFSDCTRECGGGIQTRIRTIIRNQVGGAPCPHLSESRPCNTGVCPVDCKVSEFSDSDFSECTEECGGGTQTRTRTIIQNQIGTGLPCRHLEESRPCNTHPCPLV